MDQRQVEAWRVETGGAYSMVMSSSPTDASSLCQCASEVAGTTTRTDLSTGVSGWGGKRAARKETTWEKEGYGYEVGGIAANDELNEAEMRDWGVDAWVSAEGGLRKT